MWHYRQRDLIVKYEKRREVAVSQAYKIMSASTIVSRNRNALIDSLLKSGEPSIRRKVLVQVLGEDPESRKVRRLEEEIRNSTRVRALLSHRDRQGRIEPRNNVYAKWQGAHWTLAALADLGYPAGDESLAPIRDQLLDFWLSDSFYEEFATTTKSDAYKKLGVPVMRGRYRRCASQQGNALHVLHRLGIADDRAQRLVERLLHWQWPDGGWNCDKNPGADSSSFMETLIPMTGLAIHAQAHRDTNAKQAALRASEVFLRRHLFKGRSNGKVIHPEFVRLHYPLYWHYDVLGGLKGMAELALLKDPRCSSALDLLEDKELASGGWPAEKRYYKISRRIGPGAEYIDWGGCGKTRKNEWVTADALRVLREAGRL